MTHSTKEELIDLLEDMFSLAKSLLDESERATVILAAARLDVDLERLLKRLLAPHPGGTDPLFEGDRMLGTFSAKIAFAHRLGAIDSSFEHALQMLRKIRNDFAHQLDQESLSSQRQKLRLLELTRWAENSEIYQSGIKAFESQAKSKEHLQFIVCTVCMTVLLRAGVKKYRQIQMSKPLSIAGT
ncbi:hypothetical protein ACH518_18570 [Methylomonas sp. HW2-6]|uniref:hypothetical protein n=1 Tax=Methylomonas sp. HW2-6 TaxID=3376687 RepID=UPI004041C54A